MKSRQVRALIILCCSFATVAMQAQQTAVRNAAAATTSATMKAVPVTTIGGTTGTLPYFNGSSTVLPSTLYFNSTGLGLGRIPTATLDVNGRAIVRGNVYVGRSGDATTSTGFNSYPLSFQVSVHNSSSKTNATPVFQLQAEPTGNNTATNGATLNFLWGTKETDLYFNTNGTIHFSPAQTFPITQGPVGPAGPTGPAGPKGPQGPAGPVGSVPANLTAISGQLSTTNGVAYLGSDKFNFPNTCVIGDVFLSVNGYGGGNALPADGRAIAITNHTAIFSLIGTNFGGDGRTYFNLPDVRAFAPKGMQYSICVFGVFPSLE